jgi:maleate isomerase
MNVATAVETDADTLPRSRIGLIIPSVNTFSEPQFNRFAPKDLGIHVARARVAGPWKRPLPEMAEEIATSAQLLADCAPNLIVFHCTDTSMSQGPQGEGKILDIVRDATGIDAVATSRLVLEALQVLGLKRIMLLTPYHSNKPIIDYLNASGVEVVCDVALKLEALDFGKVTPAQWTALAQQNDRPEVEGVFLSCTNTTQIDAIADIERRLDKPVVNSNQAVLWGCLRKLGTATRRPAMPELGRLMAHM